MKLLLLPCKCNIVRSFCDGSNGAIEEGEIDNNNKNVCDTIEAMHETNRQFEWVVDFSICIHAMNTTQMPRQQLFTFLFCYLQWFSSILGLISPNPQLHFYEKYE